LLHDVVLTTVITKFEFDVLNQRGPITVPSNLEQNGTEHHKIIVLV